MAFPETDLLSAARRQDPAAWDTLLRRHQLPLYSYAAELLRDPTAALDIVQETFAAAVRHVRTLRDDARFASWLFGIAHQKCIQHWRRTRRADAVFAPADLDHEEDWPDVNALDPRDQLMRREEADAFFALIEQLSLPQRSALLLHVVEDFSLEEIASISAVPVGTIKSRLHHAKRALRQKIGAAP